jgi:predicted exporter
MIAMQMKLAGGGDFKQPLMPIISEGLIIFRDFRKLVLSVVNGSLTPVASAPAAALIIFLRVHLIRI